MSAMIYSIGEEQEAFIYLNIFNLTTITNIKRMHHEQEDNCLKNCLQCIPKHENCQENLWTEEDKEMCCRYTQNKKPERKHNDPHNDISHLVQLVHCSFCIIKCKGKSFALSKGIHLHKNP